MGRILYKYLDITGAKCMIGYQNLQFTNASQLNDPFDCHPRLLDYSNIPDSIADKGIPKEWLQEKAENDALNLRNKTWLCSLSKINNSILMWSHYCSNHRGVCIGLNMDEVKKSVPPMFGTIYLEPEELEVHYQDILERPNNVRSSWYYQWQTKAKEWEYEQEVRLVIKDPSPFYAALTPEQAERKGEMDWREVHHYMPLRGECFEAVYFGINIDLTEKEKLINYALTYLNPNLKVYQMAVDENAFRLNPILEDAEVTQVPRKLNNKCKRVYKIFRM